MFNKIKCQLNKLFVVEIISRLRSPEDGCADAQAHMGIRCSHMAYGQAHIIRCSHVA